MDFHKKLMNAVPLQTIDTRPDAAEIGRRLARDPENLEAIRVFLRQHVGGEHRHLLIKDPRAFWMHEAWQAVCDELGVELTSLTMLRHPLEVAKSRETAYLEGKEEELRRIRAIANIAGWCNAAFETEGVTRAGRRSFVLYSDLVSDWRSAVRPVPDHLGVTFDSDPEQRPHPVDDFVDSQLYRSKVSWEDTDVSPALRDVAEATWQAMNRLVVAPHDQAAAAELAQLRPRYLALHDEAVAIAHDHTRGRMADVRNQVRRNRKREADTQRTRADRAEARVRTLEASADGRGVRSMARLGARRARRALRRRR